jgi:hypothetical protein
VKFHRCGRKVGRCEKEKGDGRIKEAIATASTASEGEIRRRDGRDGREGNVGARNEGTARFQQVDGVEAVVVDVPVHWRRRE